MQKQKAVSAYFTSKQIPHFAFAEQYITQKVSMHGFLRFLQCTALSSRNILKRPTPPPSPQKKERKRGNNLIQPFKLPGWIYAPGGIF